MGDEEKAAIRRDLVAGLGDSDSRMRVAVGMAVAGIAKWDVPAAWPQLLGQLVMVISERKDQRAVHGAVRCLSMFVDELEDKQVLQASTSVTPFNGGSCECWHLCLTQSVNISMSLLRLEDFICCMQVAQALFPALLAIVNSPSEYGASVRRRALQIVHSMAVMLAGVQSSADKESSKAIGALLDAWFQPFCVMLSQPTTAHVSPKLPPQP